jgi:hypothetical protein
MPRQTSNIMGLRRHFERTSCDESVSRAQVQIALVSTPSRDRWWELILKSRDIRPNFDGFQLKSAIFCTVTLIALRQTSPDQWTHRIVGLMEFVIMPPARRRSLQRDQARNGSRLRFPTRWPKRRSDAKPGTAYR